ncbi:alpha-L-rhamnosidase N-terminal domain-containing protein [Arthrobacter sp. NA-172]|uniref:alpha-L-rhamnosidase N-terminal domain-containing protein n=1 Tax=Arthrobacter sp. NA-172 TaxID=3367524 RepID=UPI003754B1E1
MLYSTGLCVYEAFINGDRVGDVQLAPGSTSYDRTLYAQGADVAGLLHLGDNAIEIVVSDGWYRGQVGAFREPAGWGDQLAARAELHLDSDWTTIVGTGPEWTSVSGHEKLPIALSGAAAPCPLKICASLTFDRWQCPGPK